MINNDEICALRSRVYYNSCFNCDGRRRHTCYVTQDDLDEHLRSFQELFEFDTSRLEEMFELNNFGMGFK